MKKIIPSLVHLFFPSACMACGETLMDQEKYLCTNCFHDIPLTNFHRHSENPVAELFWGRVYLECATSLFFYSKGSRYQKMMFKFKYHGYKEVGFELGNYLGSYLNQSAFNDVDIIVPVPLHRKKMKKRGYNQSTWIAMGIARAMQKPVNTSNLIRKTHSSTQTNKSRIERWMNVESIFDVQHSTEFQGKHILLVDDVVTTGATLEACAQKIKAIPDTKVSVATLGVANN